MKFLMIENEIRRSYLKISIVNGNVYQANFLIKPYNDISERNHEICRLYFSEGITQEELAAIFGMSQSNISKIILLSKIK